MVSKNQASSPQEYLDQLPEERKQLMTELRNVLVSHLPKGFREQMTYGMIGYVVPHSLYPNGYHCDPRLPLGFISIASQKNFVVVHHMGIYANPDLLEWFKKEYGKFNKTKLDMGKSCIRFKNIDQVPLKLLGELAGKMTPQEWVALYEKSRNKKKN